MQGNLNFAASVLQTISRDGRQDEESTRQRRPSVQEQQNVVFDNADIISNDTGINDLTSASPSSSLSVSAHSKTSVPEYHETNPNAHFMFHTQWQHSSPGVASTTTQRRPRPVAQSTQSPYNTDEFRYSLPPLSAMASHDSPGIVRSARVGQVLNLDIQESCLVKCFVENLARAVCPRLPNYSLIFLTLTILCSLTLATETITTYLSFHFVPCIALSSSMPFVRPLRDS